MADTDRESIERFVRVTLGCRCPDEVFDSVALAREPTGAGKMPFIRLVVGKRLLIYVAGAGRGVTTSDDIAALATRGRADRDTHGHNRFRLVIPAPAGAGLDESAQAVFAQTAAGDERMHLHLLPPDALPGPLRCC